MPNNVICFSADHEKVATKFKDYMNHYLAVNQHREGYIYDNTISFAEKDAKINEIMLSEVSKLSNVEIASNDAISTEMWAQHPLIKWAAFAVVNSMIDMVVPEVLDRTVGLYTEQYFVNAGDSKSFEIEPNQLFVVSKAGRDQRTVEFQKQFNGMVTIVPENREITVAANLYKVLAGKESLARFAMKAILSLESQISREVYTAMDEAMNALPTADPKLRLTGFDKEDAIELAQVVSAVNNGAEAVFMGTKLALHQILPDTTIFRTLESSDYVRIGYMREFAGFNTMLLPQVVRADKAFTLALKDNMIYVISPSSEKLVKLVYEGGSWTNNTNAFASANLTETTTITKSYGIGVATNATAGCIVLA